MLICFLYFQMRISNTYLLNINIQYLTIILLRKIKSSFPILCEKKFLLQEVVLVVVGAGRWGAGTPLLPPLSTALNSKSIFIIWEHVTNFKTFTHFRADWCCIINVHKVMVPKNKDSKYLSACLQPTAFSFMVLPTLHMKGLLLKTFSVISKKSGKLIQQLATCDCLQFHGNQNYLCGTIRKSHDQLLAVSRHNCFSQPRPRCFLLL